MGVNEKIRPRLACRYLVLAVLSPPDGLTRRQGLLSAMPRNLALPRRIRSVACGRASGHLQRASLRTENDPTRGSGVVWQMADGTSNWLPLENAASDRPEPVRDANPMELLPITHLQ